MTIHPTFTQPHSAQPYDPEFDSPLTGFGGAGPGTKWKPRHADVIPTYFVAPTSLWARMSNEDRLTRVRELNAQDISPAEIALELEATTSAIRSVAFRANLRLSGTIAVPRKGPPMVAAAPVAEETWAPLGPSVSLVQLTENTCRWPVGSAEGSEQMFCGCARSTRSAYCDDHKKMGRG